MRNLFPLLALFLFIAIAAPAHADDIDAASYIDPTLPDSGIQRAVDATGPQGGKVTLPAGRFELRRAIMLRSNITLRGAGVDKTILTLPKLEDNESFEAVSDKQIRLSRIPQTLRVNTTVYIWPKIRAGFFHGSVQVCLVTAIEGNLVTLDQPLRKIKTGVISFGQSTLLLEPCLKDAVTLKVADPSLFKVGGSVAVGSADGNANESLSFIKSIDGDTLTLERPIRIPHPFDPSGKLRPAAWALFPLLTCENAAHITITDLSLQHPFAIEGRPMMDRYTLSPIHLYNISDSLIENVHVDNSCADGISLQMGSNVTVQKCQVTGCQGNGFHPGTALHDSIFQDNIAQENGSGLYFCWENHRHIIRRNQFLKNGTGISGLGCPNDVNNTIEDNLFANSRATGLHIIGGKVSGNIIRNNTFRDNSAAFPGKFPGILLEAAVEDARAYTIEGNKFENTTTPASQSVGIEERNGIYHNLPTKADENIIKGNTFTNMALADMILVGGKSTIDQPGAKVIKGPETITHR